jgi:hypothetical protein
MIACSMAALALVSCGGADSSDTESSNSARSGEDYLAVVQATGGTLTKRSDGLELSLTGVAPQVLAFAERPERKAGALGSSTFFDTWAKEYAGAPPNSALALLNGRPDADTVVLTLEKPRWNGSSVRFHAQPVSSTPARLEQFERDIDPSIPTGFGHASLFVDAGGMMQLVAYGSQDVYVTGGGI